MCVSVSSGVLLSVVVCDTYKGCSVCLSLIAIKNNDRESINDRASNDQ